MKEQMVSYKVAKLAKEKGFNYAYEFYDKDGKLEEFGMVSGWCNSTDENYPAPTQSLLQKWLREKHNIIVFINPYPTTYAAVIQYNNREDKYATDLYDTYEEALETGLEQALKLIDNETIKSKS